jgi:hypothetical protein
VLGRAAAARRGHGAGLRAFRRARSCRSSKARAPRARLVAGEFFGLRSPVETRSPLFQVDLRLDDGARIEVPAVYPEQALYVVEGTLDLGADGVFDAGRLLVCRPGTPVTVAARGGAARVMLLGGEPMDGPRYLTWNFVASSVEAHRAGEGRLAPRALRAGAGGDGVHYRCRICREGRCRRRKGRRVIPAVQTGDYGETGVRGHRKHFCGVVCAGEDLCPGNRGIPWTSSGSSSIWLCSPAPIAASCAGGSTLARRPPMRC